MFLATTTTTTTRDGTVHQRQKANRPKSPSAEKIPLLRNRLQKMLLQKTIGPAAINLTQLLEHIQPTQNPRKLPLRLLPQIRRLSRSHPRTNHNHPKVRRLPAAPAPMTRLEAVNSAAGFFESQLVLELRHHYFANVANRSKR